MLWIYMYLVHVIWSGLIALNCKLNRWNILLYKFVCTFNTSIMMNNPRQGSSHIFYVSMIPNVMPHGNLCNPSIHGIMNQVQNCTVSINFFVHRESTQELNNYQLPCYIGCFYIITKIISWTMTILQGLVMSIFLVV